SLAMLWSLRSPGLHTKLDDARPARRVSYPSGLNLPNEIIDQHRGRFFVNRLPCQSVHIETRLAGRASSNFVCKPGDRIDQSIAKLLCVDLHTASLSST